MATASGRRRWLHFCNFYACVLPVTKLIELVKELMTINCGTYHGILEF